MDKTLIISVSLLVFIGFILVLFGRFRRRTEKKISVQLQEDKAQLPAHTERKSLSDEDFQVRPIETEKKTDIKVEKPTVIALSQPLSPWDIALKKSRDSFLVRLKDSLSELSGNQPWNESHPLWLSLEESLLAGDMGPRMTEQLLETLKKDFSEKPAPEALKQKLREKMLAVFQAVPPSKIVDSKPLVTILIGVNGAGKTTTAGKLASLAIQNGHSVILGAGDTFRAAAVDQLKAWADRLGVECIVPAQASSPSAVAFDTVSA